MAATLKGHVLFSKGKADRPSVAQVIQAGWLPIMVGIDASLVDQRGNVIASEEAEVAVAIRCSHEEGGVLPGTGRLQSIAVAAALRGLQIPRDNCTW